MPWRSEFRVIDGVIRPRFMQKSETDCGLACLAMIDARLAFDAAGEHDPCTGDTVFYPVSTSFISNDGYDTLLKKIEAKKSLFPTKLSSFKTEPSFGKGGGLTISQLKDMLALYGIGCEEGSITGFIGDLVASPLRKRMITVVKRKDGGAHFVVCDGFAQNGNLIVCDPDSMTDTKNTCLCEGVTFIPKDDEDKVIKSSSPPHLKFGNDDVGTFTGEYLRGFKYLSEYKKSWMTRKVHYFKRKTPSNPNDLEFSIH